MYKLTSLFYAHFLALLVQSNKTWDDVDGQQEMSKTPKSMKRIIPLGGDCSHCRALN